jgi:hypothetical protein
MHRIKLIGETEELKYGVLSAKQEAEDVFSVACSDSTIKLLQLAKNDTLSARVILTLDTDNPEDSCLMHASDKHVSQSQIFSLRL